MCSSPGYRSAAQRLLKNTHMPILRFFLSSFFFFLPAPLPPFPSFFHTMIFLSFFFSQLLAIPPLPATLIHHYFPYLFTGGTLHSPTRRGGGNAASIIQSDLQANHSLVSVYFSLARIRFLSRVKGKCSPFMGCLTLSTHLFPLFFFFSPLSVTSLQLLSPIFLLFLLF